MSKKWTEQEIEYIKENLGLVKINTMAEKLGRTTTAVELKMKRLGLSNTKSYTGQLTMHELAGLLNIEPKSVKLWVNNHGLRCTKKVTRNTKAFYFIKPEEFWCWAYHNKERVDFSKIDRHAILPEPDWVEEERHHQKEVNYKAWTTKEIRLMKELIELGNSYSEIGQELNRSSISIQRKYKRLIKIVN